MKKIPLMIDSGAYSAYSVGKEIKLEEYIAFCHEMKELHPHAIFVGLDVIRDPVQSWKNWIRMRKEGVDAMPVLQATWGEKWFSRYLERTDHIGLAAGGFHIRRSSDLRRQAYDTVWENFLVDKETRMPLYKVHGMAVTSFELMARYPWHSVDSTSWLLASRSGSILVPRKKRGEWDWTQPPMQVGVSWRHLGFRGVKDPSGRAGSRFQKGEKKKVDPTFGNSKHFTSLGPGEKALVLEYLKELGLRLGFRCKLEGGGHMLLRGVSTYYADRDHVNLEAYASFVQHLEWPRPFIAKRQRGGFGVMS